MCARPSAGRVVVLSWAACVHRVRHPKRALGFGDDFDQKGIAGAVGLA